MRKILIAAYVLCLVIPTFICAQETPATPRQNYLVLKGGTFMPTNDLHNYETRFNGEIAYGYRYHPNWATEVGTGYLKTDRSDHGFDARIRDDWYVVPVQFSLKGIACPAQNIELYGLAGIGMYYIHNHLRIDYSDSQISKSTNKFVPGAFFGAGITYNVTQAAFLGLEAKYLFVPNVTVGNTLHHKSDIQGIQGTLNVGFRF